MQEPVFQILVAATVAASASLLGSFAILKRMALVGDALSHVALPGMALALFFKINPFLGAVVFLGVTITGIWFVEYKSSLPLETVVGVFFTASLALGALLMPEHDLIEALFGNITVLSLEESIASMTLSLVLIVLILSIYRKLTLNMVSQEMAQSIGINNRRLEFIFLASFALAVALGIRFVGALLMGSLVIIPAASAKNISRSLKTFMASSVIFGVFSAALGIHISYSRSISPGPTFIVISSAIFIATLFVRGLKRSV